MHTLSSRAIADLIGRILDKINPDIRHPHVPYTSWVFSNPEPNPWRAGVLDKIAINPQPLPPRISFGVYLAQAVIEEAGTQLRLASVLNGKEHSERAAAAISAQIMDDIDDICWTPPRWPWPWPPIKLDEIDPVDLFVIGAQFQSFAHANDKSPLRDTFSKAAQQLFATAAQRMESN